MVQGTVWSRTRLTEHAQAGQGGSGQARGRDPLAAPLVQSALGSHPLCCRASASSSSKGRSPGGRASGCWSRLHRVRSHPTGQSQAGVQASKHRVSVCAARRGDALPSHRAKRAPCPAPAEKGSRRTKSIGGGGVGGGWAGRGETGSLCLHLGLGSGWIPGPLLVDCGAHVLRTPSHICMYGAPVVCQNLYLTCVAPHHPGLSRPYDATAPPGQDAHTLPALSLPRKYLLSATAVSVARLLAVPLRPADQFPFDCKVHSLI